MLWDAAKRMTPRCHVPDEYSETNNFKTCKTNKCYSSHDVQVPTFSPVIFTQVPT